MAGLNIPKDATELGNILAGARLSLADPMVDSFVKGVLDELLGTKDSEEKAEEAGIVGLDLLEL